ncbi:MAG: trimethylamine methyltransferase family protein, partial [Caldilinea sp.]|nr:trimethylamine methyltransferase family protein [Caldilinea sp.]
MAVDSIHAMRSARRRTVALPNTPAARVLRNTRPPYAWLDAEGLEQVHAASLDILESIGIDFLDDEALAIWQGAGARVDHAA